MELFVNALLNTLMGMGTVFVVLICISLIISLFVYVPQLEETLKGGKKKKAAEPAKPAKEAPQVVVEEEEEEEELVGDEALVAVIMAAIMAYNGDGANTTSADKLVVRSIRRAKRTGRR